MPYIRQDLRAHLLPTDYPRRARNAGELNYQFTMLAIQYVNDMGLSYEVLNGVVGALESAKAEFQRRVVAPYEDRKIKENGDVYSGS